MNNIIKKIISTILCFIVFLSALPLTSFVGLELPELNLFELKAEATTIYQGSCGENMTWLFDETTGELSISGTGEMYEYESTEYYKDGDTFYVSSVPWYKYRSDIKTVIISEGVTNICDSAFWLCVNLTSITIPNTVSEIADRAFYDCSGLTSVTIGNNVTSIGNSAFSGCDSLAVVNYLNDLSGWCMINFGLYESNPMYYAENIYINGVLFEGDITIPDDIANIGDYTFYGCSSIKNVTIPDSVISIGNNAFGECEYLESMVIPNSVTSIGYRAFSGCTSLLNITIGNNITSIDSSAFGGTAWSKDSLNRDNGVLYLGNILLDANVSGEYVIKDGTKIIADKAFYYCTGLTSVTIPDSVINMGSSVFEECTSLKTVKLSNNLKAIGALTFYKCNNITELIIPDSVETIGYLAFWNCTSLTSITIGSGVSSINEDTFMGCSNLSDFYYNGNLANWCNIRFETSVSNPLYYAENFYSNSFSLHGNIVIPDEVTNIGDFTFYGCAGLESVTIPEGVKSIGDYAFYGCTNVTNVEIPESVLNIGDYAFYECTSLESISIPNGITSIGKCAFYGCTSLTRITLPDTVTNIGTAAFDSTGYYNDSLNWEENILYIDNHLISAKTSIWRCNIKNGTRTIAGSAFEFCENISSITIPDSVTSIGDEAFCYCDSLTSITIPDSVTRIGDKAFFNCYNLKSLIIPETVTNIGANAFEDCSSLTSVNIPKGVTQIRNGSFIGCTRLSNVIIPASVEYISYDAFDECTNISDVYYDGSLEAWKVLCARSDELRSATCHYSVYTVYWNIDEKTISQNVKVGNKIIPPETPQKPHYEFNGWNISIPSKMPEYNLYFTARWESKEYTVTWIIEDKNIETQYKYNSIITIPELPAKTGYSIVWDKEIPATMPGENLTFIASWAINSYTVTWKYGDKSVQQTYEYNSPITPPEAEVSGYEFIKWIPETPELMPAEDLEFEAFLASTEFDGGWGTEENPYLISTKEQLNQIRNHSDRCFKLTNDIVFTESDFASGGAFYNGGKGWTPIPKFTGVIDGDGYAIRGLKIVASVTDDSSLQNCSVGFISRLDGEIMNLGLLDGSISVTAKNVKQFYVGAFAGYGNYYSVITNCFNNCDVKCTETLNLGLYSDEDQPMFNGAVGGIAGSGVYVVSSSNEGDVTVNTTTTKPALSWAYDDLLKHDILVGGIVGDDAAVKECYNSGDVTLKFNFKNTSSDGKLYADCNYFAGGIAGEDASVSDSYNTGSINVSMGSSGAVYDWDLNPIASGIIGAISGYEVNRCYNTGTLSGVDDNCAGITVIFGSGQVYNCYYSDNVEDGVIQVENKGWVSDTSSFSDISELKSKFNKSPWMIDVNGVPVLESTIRPARIVEISESEVSVVNKETIQLSATILPDYATYKDVTWSSSNNNVATVDENGLVTAKKIGEATIRATGLYSNAFAECKVTVTPADFTITWIVDGVETEETVTETNAIVEPETPVKYGYTFSGWTPDIPDVMPDENLIFNGTWAPVECELTFDASIGSWADSTTERTETVDFNSEIVVPEAPSKPGYVFLGWALDNVNLGTDLGEMDDINGKEFKAVWVASTDTRYAVETYTMNTEGEYVKTIQNFTGETDSTVNAEYVIEEGFKLNDEMSVLSGTITADNSLVLKVYIDRNVYIFTTIIDGVSTETMYFYDSVIAEPANPSKTGYTFIAWDKSVPASMPARDVTITAEFDANSYDAIFNANGGKWSDGSTSKTVATDFDRKIIAPANPTKQGYDFAGWDVEIGIMDDVNGKTFTAKWIARNDTKYTVETYTMGADGKYVVTTKTKQGTTDTVAAAETDIVTGFALNEVNSVLEGTIAGDSSLVLKVYIDRNTYTFTTVVDGVSTSKSYLYGSTVSEPVTPSKPGYKFIKWNGTIPQTMPAENLTVTAVFEKSYLCPDCGKEILGEDAINKHIASETKVNIDGGNIVSGVVSPGATITVSAPQTNGKIFSHWEVTNATVADADSAETTVVLGSGKISITAVYVDCDCKCHQGGIAGFFFKITLFFQKLFGKNLECICGSKH